MPAPPRPGAPATPAAASARPGRRRPGRAPAPPRRVQLTLFAGLPRATATGASICAPAVPASPWLAWALHLAHTMAEARGWTRDMLGTSTGSWSSAGRLHRGDHDRVSDFRRALASAGASITRAAEVLAAMGVLADDRPAAFDTWLAAKLDGLAPGIAARPPLGPCPARRHAAHPRPARTRPSAAYIAAPARPC